MITILPVGQRERKDRVIRGIAGAESNAEMLIMQDSGREIGYAAVDVKDDAVRILELELFDRADDRLSADSLMRAAASFGAAAGARRIESQIGGFEEVFLTAGFRRTKDGFLCDLSELIKNKRCSRSNP